MIDLVFCAVLALAPQEECLRSRLPEIFGRAAGHYRALDAAATPLMKDTKGNARTPHGWLKWKTGKNELDMRSVYWWTSGHYPGSLWYLHEATGDAFFRERALAWTALIEPVKNYDGNHDVGFMTYCSFGNARRILKTNRYDPILLKAADSLVHRYDARLGLIRSWGLITNRTEFLVIPDNMMNLELLMAASAMKGGGRRFADVAMSHADKSMANHFRDDGGCYHVLNYDQRPGFEGSVSEIRRGQGLSCRTAWSRGQSWGIYGYTMMYRMTGLRRYLDFAMKLADHAIDHPNMPADGVPLWDYGARPDEERDTSAASCMASALVELSTFVGPEARARYRAFAVKQLLALSSPAYFSEGDEVGHFLLKHGVGHKPGGSEVDTPLDYGDYYFLEALLRFRNLADGESKRAEIAAALPEKAGLPEDEYVRHFVRKENAEEFLTMPIPDVADALYLEFAETGNRTHYQEPYFRRQQMLDVLVAAEFREGKGRYLAKIEEVLSAFCGMRTWVMNAHDGELDNFHGRRQTVDLGSSSIAAQLACALNMIGDRLPPRTVARVRERMEYFVFTPLRRELAVRRLLGAAAPAAKCLHWWMDNIYNWNAVCWDGAMTAAFGVLDDPRDRALFAAGTMKASDYYLRGFRADGYCDEGMGYWNYGYGHHLKSACLLRAVSGGRLNLLADPRERFIAAYGRGDSFDEKSAPEFADGGGAAGKGLLALADEFFPDMPKGYPPSTAFPEAQTWIFRDPEGISVAFKGGDNGVAHNHNDLGSYDLRLRGLKASGDPGHEVYTARTFSKNRYVSDVLNSFGHPVPVVDGQLQGTGASFRAEVVSAKIDDAGTSEVVLDLKKAYAVKALRSLTRTFRYDRPAKTFTVTDRVAFAEPAEFEDAYIAFREIDNKARKGFVWEVRPKVMVKGAGYRIVEKAIGNPGAVSPYRVGVKLEGRVSAAEVEFRF